MTTPADDEPETPRRFMLQFHTPFGTYNDLDDLPPEARAFIAEHLDALDLPAEARAHLEAELRPSQPRRPRHAAESGTPEAEAAGHEPGCEHDEEHRLQVWSILDTAFGSEPHLWRAGEVLFALSATNPRPLDEGARVAAIAEATQHLEHHAARPAPSLSPADELVERFRQQLGGM